MKAKTILLLSLVTFVLFCNLHNSFASDIEQYFYTLGYRDGYARGFAEGYRKAWLERGEKDRKVVRLYKKELEAARAGKYLFRLKKITAPEVYRVTLPDGSVVLKVRGCEIKDPEGLEELLAQIDADPPKLPEVCSLCADLVKPLQAKPDIDWSAPILPGVAGGLSELTQDLRPEAIYRVEVKPEHLGLLDKERIPYIAVVEKGKEKYYAVFTRKEALRSFCTKYQSVCGKVHVNSIVSPVPVGKPKSVPVSDVNTHQKQEQGETAE